MIKIQTAANFFDSFWGNEEAAPANDTFPFKLRVAVAGYRITPRHSCFEYFRELGMSLLEPLIKHQHIPELETGDGHLTFVLPERWLSVHEQQMFLYRIKDHPQVARIKQVDVVTQEALIVGGCPQGTVKLFNFPSDDPSMPGVGRLAQDDD